MNQKRPTQKLIIIKMSKVKDKQRILKAAREKSMTNLQGAPIELSVDFLTETLQVRRDWTEIFKVMKKQGPTIKSALSSKTII